MTAAVDLRALEQASFASWPALHEEDVSGWRLRFAKGYTKRANSANAVQHVDSLEGAQLQAIASAYRSRGLPTIFRLASFCTHAAVDTYLADQGYQFADLSWVMVRTLLPGAFAIPSTVSSTPRPAGNDAVTWLAQYAHVSGHVLSEQEVHLQMLQSIAGPTAFASAQDEQGAVCCGLGVLSRGRLGLFDVATRSDARGRGHASALCASLLAWGQARGAVQAYLQVVGANRTAIRLYESMGFRRAYHYWYRIEPQAK